MFKKFTLGLLVVITVAGTIIWFNRATILTHIVLNRAEAAKEYIAPHEPIVWQAGPTEPIPSDEDRPPNIVFILLDDFGYNDLSTFGGGVADGRVSTPNIDRLAAEGAIFSQAYSGTGKRWLQGCYADKDGLRSPRDALLRKRLEAAE